ncbi:MAG: hypothetical protein Kow0027_23250 [Saprospiraceae bacterium]
MKEINRSTLVEALSMLPEYDPPDETWQMVEAELDLLAVLPEKESVAELLPEFDPPDEVWNQVSKQLDGAGKVVPMRKWVARIAAAVVLLVAAWWALNTNQPSQDEGTISYSVEVLDPILEKNDWDEDEDAFQQFMAICQNGHFICEQPSFKNLEAELEELTEAKNELKEAIGAYGASPVLVQQIKEIELERTDILKKMMVMLI